jgi:steroid 5-alpha reductase family enzyme
MGAIWQFIKKYEFWVAMVVWVGLLIAFLITEDAILPTLMTLVLIVSGTRLAMHPMWKKDKEAEGK